MVDRHVEQGQPVVIAQERLPVRDRAHLDRGEHRLAEIAAVEQLLEHADRLVEAHVLVDREDLARRLRLGGERARVAKSIASGFCARIALIWRLPQREADQRGLLVGREREVEDFDLRSSISAGRIVMHLRDVPAPRDLRGLRLLREAIATTGKPASA